MDIGKMKDVVQEPVTPAEALETIPDGLILRRISDVWSIAKLKV